MLLRADSLADSHAIASALADLARVGDIIVLAGEMGAGKTAFAQGFGRALGITEPITSPTFTLVHSYSCPGKVTLHHADIYRLDSTGDVDELALPEVRLGNDDLDGDLDTDDEFGLDQARLIELEATGRSWAGRWDRLTQAMEAFRC
jgi:tRNA threonylcarbamoyladenosine biosynthesis protein TsaE